MSSGPPCRAILVGMMGSGKSTVGRLLSIATGWPYLDNDALVVEDQGMTSRDLLARRGEVAMRHAESRALDRGLVAGTPSIVAAAAGTILDPASRAAIAGSGLIVWLRAETGTLAERAIGAPHRPWLDASADEWLAASAAERDPLYASVADLVVDTDSSTPDAAVTRIVAALRNLDGCGRLIGSR